MSAPLLLALLSLVAEGHVSSLSEMYGSLESPNFPEPYPQDLDLRWDLTVPPGFRVRLDFSHFHLEPSYRCEYDYLRVESDGETLGLFCGVEATDTEAVPGDSSISSASNKLSLSFCSDFSNEERYTGFRAHYSAEDIDECREQADEDLLCDHFCHNFIGGFYCSCRHGYRLHQDNRTCTVQCSEVVFRERAGVLNSPDFPGPYPKSSDCLYRIQVQPGFRVRLQFDPVFDIEAHPEVTCPYDYVQISAGGREFGPFCGDKSPGTIETETNSVAIVFHSDNSGENRGWSLSYSAVGTVCAAPETPPHAVLNPVQSEYSFTDHVLFTCEPGHKLLKDGEFLEHFQLDCQDNGSWSSSSPQCQVVDCGSPKLVDLAEVVFGDDDNSTVFGSTLRYVCLNDSVQLNSSFSEFRCGADGEWTNPGTGTTLPSCQTGCGLPSRPLPSLVKRIVGGRTADPGMFPWQVLLSVEDRTRIPEDRWFGSGALLSETWVLTAAHVLRSQRRDATVVPLEPAHVQVYLGVHSVRQKDLAQRRTVELIVLHPDFQPENYDNDIAMVKLSWGAGLSDVIRPICLPPIRSQADPLLPEPQSLGVVSGWGISNLNTTSSSPAPLVTTSDPSALSSDPMALTSDLLQLVKLPVVPQDECRASYASRSIGYNITDNMFCAGFFEGGRDTCLGDSGGAFVSQSVTKDTRRWAVLGLVSWGGPEDCGSQRVYGVYTRVSNYVEWIQQHLNS